MQEGLPVVPALSLPGRDAREVSDQMPSQVASGAKLDTEAVSVCQLGVSWPSLRIHGLITGRT